MVATYDIGVRAVAVGAVGAWRVYQAIKRPTRPESLAITVLCLGLFASILFEWWSLSESAAPVGRPYLPAAGQMICLALMQTALCAYYAFADGSRGAMRMLRAVAGLEVINAVAVAICAACVPAGVALLEVGNDAAYRFYLVLLPPIATTASGVLAVRAARKALGTLRIALLLAATALWALAAGTVWLPFKYSCARRHVAAPNWAADFFPALFVVAALTFVASVALVGIAHRATQLRAIIRAGRDALIMRPLRRDLQLLLPTLTFPRTGRAPMALRPHYARYRAYIEIRDRLLTLSPYLIDEDSADAGPEMIAAALRALGEQSFQIQRDRKLSPQRVLPHGDDSDMASVIELAKCYAAQRDHRAGGRSHDDGEGARARW